MSFNTQRVIIAAGGTGGHIVPSIVVAKELKKKGVEIFWICSTRKRDSEILSSYNWKLYPLDIKGVKGRGVYGVLNYFFSFPKSARKVAAILKEVKPFAIFGCGGYLSVLPVLIGKLKGIPACIHEAETAPGLANKALAPFVDLITTAYTECPFSSLKKTVVTGQPLREEIFKVKKRKRFSSKPQNLLILGGSQGANSLDKIALKLIPFFSEHNLAVIHQCREENLNYLISAYKEGGVKAEVKPFIKEIEEAYSQCDLIISRAGANAVAEIDVVGVPAILIPLPSSSYNHQLKNALLLEQKGQGLCVEEEKDKTDKKVKEVLSYLLSSPEKYREMIKKEPLTPENAALKIAEEIVKLKSR